jgi:twitching motility protein PilT
MPTDTLQVTGGTEVIQHAPRKIDELLREVLAKGGSDLHFVAGDPPRIRLNGELSSLRDVPLDKEFVRETIYDFITRRAQAQLEEKDGADFA